MRIRLQLEVLLVGFALVVGPAAAAVAEGDVDRTALLEIPVPSLDNFEPTALRRLQEEREAFDRLIAGDLTSEELAEAYGSLGQLYYIHDVPAVAEVCFTNALHLQAEDFRWHYFAGVLDADAGELDTAMASFERVLSLQPGYAPAQVRLGRAQLAAGNLEGAQQTFRELLDQDPENAAAEYGLGQIAFERGEFDTAIAHLQSALDLQPTATRIHYLLGMAYREKGDRETALEHLKQKRDDPVQFDDPLTRELFRLVDSAKVHFNHALQLLEENQLDLAIEQFRLAIEKDPDDFLYHYNLGSALVAAGEEEEGLASFRRALELNPDFRDGHFNLAATLARRNQLAEAVEHFEIAHRLDPDDPLPHLEWATALERTGRPERAAEELTRLLEQTPGYPQALLNLGTVQAQLGRLEEATGTLEQLTESDAEAVTRAAASIQLGRIAVQMGQDRRAIEYFNTALELDLSLSEAHVALGQSFGRAGQFSQAAFHFQQAALLEPDDLDAHFGHALALMLAGSLSEARRELEKSLRLHPDSVPLKHLLARLLATAPEAEVRDGGRALVLAREAFSQQASPEHAETVAMAYAEQGRFDEAVSWQERVVAEIEVRGGDAPAAVRERLELYRAGKPCRAPWQSG